VTGCVDIVVGMKKSISRKAVLIGTGATALALGIAVPAVASATDPSASPTPSASTSASDPASDREQKHADRRDKLAEGLAAELGVSKERVLAALEKVETQLESDARAERLAGLKERLDAAVADGKLTDEQASAILKAAEAGVLPGGPHGPGGHRWPGPGR
jgi:hypothetical protein